MFLRMVDIYMGLVKILSWGCIYIKIYMKRWFIKIEDEGGDIDKIIFLWFDNILFI